MTDAAHDPSDGPAGRLAGRTFRAVVMGASAGGMQALLSVLGRLPADYGLPEIAVQHLHPTDGGKLAALLDEKLALRVVEADDKQPTAPGCVYLAPAGYHLLLERDGSLSLSIDPKVNFSRPSIDVLFESAARACGEALIGVILSGANEDGAAGMALIKELGGVCIAQEPSTAESPVMPGTAIVQAKIDIVLAPEAIGELLSRLGATGGAGGARPTGTAERERT